jgi:hypothetical protein
VLSFYAQECIRDLLNYRAAIHEIRDYDEIRKMGLDVKFYTAWEMVKSVVQILIPGTTEKAKKDRAEATMIEALGDNIVTAEEEEGEKGGEVQEQDGGSSRGRIVKPANVGTLEPSAKLASHELCMCKLHHNMIVTLI